MFFFTSQSSQLWGQGQYGPCLAFAADPWLEAMSPGGHGLMIPADFQMETHKKNWHFKVRLNPRHFGTWQEFLQNLFVIYGRSIAIISQLWHLSWTLIAGVWWYHTFLGWCSFTGRSWTMVATQEDVAREVSLLAQESLGSCARCIDGEIKCQPRINNPPPQKVKMTLQAISWFPP